MAYVTPARNNIDVKDVQFRASISSAVGNKIAAGLNFINTKHTDQHSFHLNGDVALLQQEQVGDGFYFAIFNMEITGYSLVSGRGGTSGATIVDLHKVSADGTDSGTIFSLKPQISTSAADESSQFRNEIDSSTGAPTGHTLGEFSSTTIDQGEKLRFDIDSAMAGSENLTLTIYFRPR